MENKKRSLKFVAVVMVFTLAACIISCNKSSDPINGAVSQTVSNESSQDSQQDEVDDISTGQMNKMDSKGRYMTTADPRVACAYITIDTVSKSGGTITINFDKTPAGDANPAGCTDAKGNVRKGSITISFEGRWYASGSVITTTLTDYSINGVVLAGSRTLHNVTPNGTPLVPTWDITSHINISWPDSKTATREVTKTRAWDILAGTVTVTKTSGAASAASGTTRNGVSYTMDITNPLVFKLSCVGSSKVYIPVSGTKVITFDGKTATVDFGSGDCDNTFTVTYNGKTDSFAASNDSNN